MHRRDFLASTAALTSLATDEGLDASLRTLQQSVWDAQDATEAANAAQEKANAIASERAQLEDERTGRSGDRREEHCAQGTARCARSVRNGI